MTANITVMEIKVIERIPHWIVELIKSNNLQLIRVSKYCKSIEAAQNIPSLRRHNLMNESSQEVLSSSEESMT
jgi:hypothetical protein